MAPTLEAGQVVALDRLGAHKTSKVRDLIEERKADLLFLASYSPDLNPIEEAFSKIKNIVRKAGARSREALDEAMGEALSAVVLEDVAGWFSHCGYEPRDQRLMNIAVKSRVMLTLRTDEGLVSPTSGGKFS